MSSKRRNLPPVKTTLIFCYKYSVGYGPNLVCFHHNLLIIRPPMLQAHPLRAWDFVWIHVHINNYFLTSISQLTTSSIIVNIFCFFGSAEILSDTGHGWFSQHQCHENTNWENTEQCCPHGNSSPWHSAICWCNTSSSGPGQHSQMRYGHNSWKYTSAV